jgi:hypothetical protein
MGMYTALHIAFEIEDVEATSILHYMIGQGPRPHSLPDHPLFQTPRWQFMLTCDSYYFDYDSSANMISYPSEETAHRHLVSVTSNFKNYDDEIDKFLDWVSPYIVTKDREWVGYMMNEEDERPTNIVWRDNILKVEVEE